MKAAYKSKNKKRLIALVVLAAFLFVMLFSSCFLVKEAEHHCSDASCSICAVIQLCENNLRQIGTGHTAIAVVTTGFILLFQVIAADHTVAFIDTLITRKVRLNN